MFSFCAQSRSHSNRFAGLLLRRTPKKQHIRSKTFASSSSSQNNGNTARSKRRNNDQVCLVADRSKYQSWPSEEYAAFAFARLATPGHTSIGPSEFISVVKEMQLDFNLGDHELRRVFDSLDANGDGRLSLDEFTSGRGRHPFVKTLVETLSGSCSLFASGHFPDPDFDCNRSTAEFYSAPLESGFAGENVAIRQSLDYDYHNNYTKKRQFFQDALIKNNVLLDGSGGSDNPWYVLTCGPMGAGKGYVLGWMSANHILEIERVSKIDPDAFKLKMPEWQVYQQNGMKAEAGSRTHAESSYIAEIAQHLAMNNNMDVWVDGSLRNWNWYEIELQRIRKQYPQYRIAIIFISASEEMIESNIKQRAKETGRDVPDHLRQATSNDEIGKGIIKLTYLVDLIASVCNNPIQNEGDGGVISGPDLRFVSMVDRSGNWDLIRDMATKH